MAFLFMFTALFVVYLLADVSFTREETLVHFVLCVFQLSRTMPDAS